MSFPPWSTSPNPSNSTESPSEVITLSTATLNVLGESIEKGIASRAIQSSSDICSIEEFLSCALIHHVLSYHFWFMFQERFKLSYSFLHGNFSRRDGDIEERRTSGKFLQNVIADICKPLGISRARLYRYINISK